MKDQLQRVTVNGAIHGDYLVEEQHADGKVLLSPAPYPAVAVSYPGRAASEAEFAQFQRDHGVLPPDGEG